MILGVLALLAAAAGIGGPASAASPGGAGAVQGRDWPRAIWDAVRMMPGKLDAVLRFGALLDMAMRPGGIALAAQGAAEGVARCDNPMMPDVARSAFANVQANLPSGLRITAIRDIHEVSATWVERVCGASVRINGGDWQPAIYEIRPIDKTSEIIFTVR